jgi:hypothetical protein
VYRHFIKQATEQKAQLWRLKILARHQSTHMNPQFSL